MRTLVATEPEVTPKIEVTPEELLAMPDGGHYELIDGELKERRMSALSNLVAIEVGAILRNHYHQSQSGWLFAAELGYRCFPWKPDKVRRADVSYVDRERYSWEQLTQDGFLTIPPDLAVEVVSPNDYVRELEEKIEEYLRAGVRLVWVVYPEIRIVHIYRKDGTTGRLRADNELSGEDVLPGFRCKVEDLFPRPREAESHNPTDRGAASPSPASRD